MKSTKPLLIDSALTALLALPCLGGRVTFDRRDSGRLLRFAYQVIPFLTDEELLSIYSKPKWTAENVRTFLIGRIGIELAVLSFSGVAEGKPESVDVDDAEVECITQLLLDEYKKDNRATVASLSERAAVSGNIREGRIKHVLYTYILPAGPHRGCKEMRRQYHGKIQRFNKAKQYLQYLIDIEGR